MKKKHPFLMALAVFGAIFIVFFALILAVGSLSGRPTAFPLGEKVGVVPVLGAITTSEKINQSLIRFREDPSIKAIVLRVDSPGGGVGPSQEIYQEVLKTIKTKPVVVSMASVAASGGYYVSAPASRIVANPGTMTGSIGVIMQFTNVQDLLDKIGLKTSVVKSGQHKDIGSPIRPMSEEDRQILQKLISDVHNQFVSAVSEGRSLERAKVSEIADGRIFSGSQALDLGLVDQLGNFYEAVSLAGELAGIEGEPNLIYPKKEKPQFIEYLIQESINQLGQELRQDDAPGVQYLWNGH